MSSTSSSSRVRRAAAVLGASAVAVTGAYGLLGAGTGTASSHREAPLIANDPTADNTDTYAFVSPDKPNTVTLIANWYPFEDPAGGPNFFPWATEDQARYNIKIDNNGDAVPDITYQWTFQTQDTRGDVDYPGTDADGSFLYNNGAVTSLDDENLLFKQTYTLTQINGDGTSTVLLKDAPVAPDNVGAASMPDYGSLRGAAVVPVKGGGSSFVGQADDSFFLDLRIFDLLYGADLSEAGHDTLNGYNVNAVALQVPISDVVAGGDPVIGVWSTTDRPTMRMQDPSGTQAYSGDFVQVSRLGNPLINEVVIPASLKDAFNALAPVNDHTVAPAVAKVLDPEVPKLIEALYGIKAPATPRNDLLHIFLTGLKGLNMPANADTLVPSEQLRLNTSIPPTAEPNRLGVLAGDNAGFPNGRRLADDVVDIAVQAVEGAVTVDEDGMATGVHIVEPLAAGDGVNENDHPFGNVFPYLSEPNSGSTERGAIEVPPTSTPTPTVTLPTGPPNTGAASDDGNGVPVLPLGAAALALALVGYGALSLRKQRTTASK